MENRCWEKEIASEIYVMSPKFTSNIKQVKPKWLTFIPIKLSEKQKFSDGFKGTEVN